MLPPGRGFVVRAGRPCSSRLLAPPHVMSRILLTSALPYANGSIHLGHLVEYVQSDIFTRAHRLAGTEILHVCADDTHGTPIEMNARRQGITPEELIARSYDEHSAAFAAFDVSFDIFGSTNDPVNREMAEFVYGQLKERGYIVKESRAQMYSPTLGRFLSDRMVKGTCPKCGTEDQYGDNCEQCGTTYEPTALLNPRVAETGETPELRDTENLYVTLSAFDTFLREWLERSVPQESTRKFVLSWLDGGLMNWCISRDAPYFGFEIPGEPGKYFYVWLDAPIGYVSMTKQWCDANGQDWRTWWGPDADTRVVHNIGKDIVYFHTLFWPAMLHAAELKTPDEVRVHGMLTVNGTKMSKSRGTFINAATYLEHLDPEYLRFYYASKLAGTSDDIDLHLEEFVARVNAELVNNVVNLCSRVTKFIEKRFDGAVVPFDAASEPLCAKIAEGLAHARAAYAAWDTRAAIRSIVEVGDAVNQYMQDAAPWAVIKDDPAEAQRLCSVVLHGATAVMAALVPVTPRLTARYAAALGESQLSWAHADPTWQPTSVGGPDTLLDRVDADAVAAIVEASKPTAEPAASPDAIEVEAFEDEIEFPDFAKVDLRVGVVEAATFVEGASKLLQLTVHCGKRINVFAGVRSAYPDPSVLVGRRVVVVANLKPRKMRFGVSEGMLLATSGPNDEGLQLVHPDASTLGGWTVR